MSLVSGSSADGEVIGGGSGAFRLFEKAGRDEELQLATAPMQLAPASDIHLKMGQPCGREAQIHPSVRAGAQAGDQLGNARIVANQEDMVGSVVGFLEDVQQGVGRGGVNAVIPAEIA